LADAYKLDQMLQQQIQTFGQCANAPESVADPNLRQTAEDSRETLNQLKRLSEQEPTRDAFREPLRQALSGNNKVKLDTTLNQVQQTADTAAKQQRAGEARDALQQVRQAFSDSKPGTLQMADENDLLKTPDAECLNAGVAGLENLLQRLEKNGRKPGENETKQARESLFNVQTGLRNDYGDNERAVVLQTEIKELLKSEMPLNVDALKKLLAQLQHFSVETSEKLNPGEKPQLAHIDPSRLPPAYRGRIQKYFQKLSEK
jgi:hypothetical protein